MTSLAHGLVLALSLSPCVVSGQHASSWHRPNDESLSGIDLDAYHCGQECKHNLPKGIQTDRAGFGDLPFNADFYRTADNFTGLSEPGDVLKVQSYINDTSSWSLPGGATLYRVQYVSIGQDDKKVPATAFVIIPFAKNLDSEPFPIVAYAHGTIGTFYGCAPSSSHSLCDYDTWRPLYLAGYAVVATDYAGLGNNHTSHHYLASTLAAGDIYYSVIAAKKAFGSILGNKWASTGHSQGGGAVWALVESEFITSSAPLSQKHGLEFVGGVSISPAPRFADIVKTFAQQNQTTTLCAYAPFFYAALEAVKPGSASDLFTPVMQKRIALGQHVGVCLESGGTLGLDLCRKGEVYQNLSSMQTYPPLQSFQRDYGAAIGSTSKAPMLVIQSYGDNTVSWTVTAEAWKTTCHAGGFPVQLSIYPALDHSPTPGASSKEWLEWLEERFQGKTKESKCVRREREATDVASAWSPRG